MNDTLSMCREVTRRVAEIQMAEIEKHAMLAAAGGFNLAVAPISVGEVPEGEPKTVFSVKQHIQLLRPGIHAPAGWTTYELAPVHPMLMAVGQIARDTYRIVNGRHGCDQCGGTGFQSTKNCFWCEGRGYRL